MRARSFLTALVVVAAIAAPAGAGPLPDTPLVSGNVTLVGTIPDVPAIGGHVRRFQTALGPKDYLLMSTLRGVSVYDLTIPEAPVLAGHLELPHIENEDIDFGDDIAIVSVDPGFTLSTQTAGLYILDISQLPAITFAYVNPTSGNRFLEPVRNGAGHTTTCPVVPGEPACSWAYVNGTGTVQIVDLRNPANPVVRGSFSSAVGSTHDAQVDASGILWMVGGGGYAAYDTSNPLQPKLIARGGGDGLQYHHNSWRPRADEWVARAPGDDAGPLRPGETLLVTEEDWLQPTCGSQGRFGTVSIKNFDRAAGGSLNRPMMDTWATELSTLGVQTGAVLSAAATCSAHYFTERDGIVAIGWYEQGTRFLDVSDPNDIRQVGYILPPKAVTWAAVWIGPGALGGEIVYTLDAARGIDILRFDRGAGLRTVRAPILPEWLNGTSAPAAPHPVWGYACRLPL